MKFRPRRNICLLWHRVDRLSNYFFYQNQKMLIKCNLFYMKSSESCSCVWIRVIVKSFFFGCIKKKKKKIIISSVYILERILGFFCTLCRLYFSLKTVVESQWVPRKNELPFYYTTPNIKMLLYLLNCWLKRKFKIQNI